TEFLHLAPPRGGARSQPLSLECRYRTTRDRPRDRSRHEATIHTPMGYLCQLAAPTPACKPGLMVVAVRLPASGMRLRLGGRVGGRERIVEGVIELALAFFHFRRDQLWPLVV